ncbi:MAG: hypothetical protein HQ567_13955, partial [Candidatus Nealsonbacteria bacterium]|nr:hypothetical protein [Candidatus Nealsonbacteria bacterium]
MNTHKNLSLCTALCLGLVLLATSSAFAVVGDIAIFREAAGTNAITTANFDHTFDTVVRDTGNYSLTGSDISITEAGHYLALYNSRFDSTGGSDRSEIQSQLVVDGLDVSIGWSQGYIRRTSGADEAITAGGGIIEGGAGSTLSLRSFRTDNNGAGVQREPNATGIQLVQLDDSWDYLRLSATANQTGPANATYIDVTYDTQDELDAGSFAHASGSGDITLATAGHYMVLANTYFQKPANTTRTGFQQRLTIDGNELNGSLTTVYVRGNEDSNDGATSIGTIIETTADNQILNVEVNKLTGTAPDILGGRTGLTIVKLPDTGDFIRLEDSTAQDFNPATTTAIGWDTELELDATGFTQSG